MHLKHIKNRPTWIRAEVKGSPAGRGWSKGVKWVFPPLWQSRLTTALTSVTLLGSLRPLLAIGLDPRRPSSTGGTHKGEGLISRRPSGVGGLCSRPPRVVSPTKALGWKALSCSDGVGMSSPASATCMEFSVVERRNARPPCPQWGFMRPWGGGAGSQCLLIS